MNADSTRTVRVRLALWHALALAMTLLALSFVGMAVLRWRLEARVDRSLTVALDGAAAALRSERAEGESPREAAESVARESLTARQGVAILDEEGRLLAKRALPTADLPAGAGAVVDAPATYAIGASRRVRSAARRLDGLDGGYRLVVYESMDEVDEDLALVRRSALVVLPLACALTALAGWVVAGRTLRPIRELLGRLESSFDRQRRFMADASHELRTPLSIVRTAASMTLQRAERDQAEYREALDVIGGQAERASRLVDDLLVLARADSGEYPMRRRFVDLGEVARDCIQAMRVLAAARGVAVRAAEGLSGQEAQCLADDELLRRMLANLVENAIAHAPAEGVVEVRLATEAEGYALFVSDSGRGIAPADRARVFDRFYRADGDGARTGAGLGLAISRWIAEAHGGSLVLADGPGCTFVARLPRGA